MVVFGGLWFLVPALTWAHGDAIDWYGETSRSAVAPRMQMVDGAQAFFEGQVHVIIDDPSVELRLLSWLPGAIVATAVIVTGFLLLRLMYATQDGQPFFATSVRRLRTISLVIGAAAILQPLAWSAVNHAVLEAATTDVRVEPQVHFAAMATWLVVALVVRVMAEAFRVGTGLRADVEGLV
jgi:hypothetical protein